VSQPREFPRLQEFLAEADDEDIISGLRKLISAIRSGWSSNFSSIKKEQKTLWRKLTPAQQQRLKTTFTGLVRHLFNNPDNTVDLDTVTVQDKNEAAFVASTFLALSSSLSEVNTLVTDQLVRDGVITKDEGANFKAHFANQGGPVGIPNSTLVAQFLTQHTALLQKLIAVYDNEITFDIATVTNNIKKAIDQTPETQRRQAALGIHYFLLNMSRDLFKAYQASGKKFASVPDPVTAD